MCWPKQTLSGVLAQKDFEEVLEFNKQMQVETSWLIKIPAMGLEQETEAYLPGTCPTQIDCIKRLLFLWQTQFFIPSSVVSLTPQDWQEGTAPKTLLFPKHSIVYTVLLVGVEGGCQLFNSSRCTESGCIAQGPTLSFGSVNPPQNLLQGPEYLSAFWLSVQVWKKDSLT